MICSCSSRYRRRSSSSRGQVLRHRWALSLVFLRFRRCSLVWSTGTGRCCSFGALSSSGGCRFGLWLFGTGSCFEVLFGRVSRFLAFVRELWSWEHYSILVLCLGSMAALLQGCFLLCVCETGLAIVQILCIGYLVSLSPGMVLRPSSFSALGVKILRCCFHYCWQRLSGSLGCQHRRSLWHQWVADDVLQTGWTIYSHWDCCTPDVEMAGSPTDTASSAFPFQSSVITSSLSISDFSDSPYSSTHWVDLEVTTVLDCSSWSHWWKSQFFGWYFWIYGVSSYRPDLWPCAVRLLLKNVYHWIKPFDFWIFCQNLTILE